MTTRMFKHQQLSLIVVMLKTKVRLAKRPAIILFWEIWIIVNLLGKLFWSKILVTDCQSRRCNLLLSNWLNFISPDSAVKRSESFSRNVFKRCPRPREIEHFLNFTQTAVTEIKKASSLQGNISRISRRCLSVISNLVQTFKTIFFPIFLRLQASSERESGISLSVIEPGVSLWGEVLSSTKFLGWKTLAIPAKNVLRSKQYGSRLYTKNISI